MDAKRSYFSRFYVEDQMRLLSSPSSMAGRAQKKGKRIMLLNIMYDADCV